MHLSKETELYVKLLLSKKQRSSLAKFRCASAPIRLETGRYEGLAVEDRKCQFCPDYIEDEIHVFTECCLYDDLRNELFNNMTMFMPDFNACDNSTKTQLILSCQNFNIVKCVAKICNLILERRNQFYIVSHKSV